MNRPVPLLTVLASVAKWAARGAVPLLVLTIMAASVAPALASPPPPTRPKVIVLPGAESAEGIAAGEGSTFYAGELFTGDIFRGDIRTGQAERFIDAPAGRNALGMAFHARHHLLVVAGGFTGQAYVYNTGTGAAVADYQFAAPGSSVVNDVALTRDGAWFTDSRQGRLYFVPISREGVPGPFRTLVLSGPAADTSGEFNLNGIQATADGRTLVVAHSTKGELYTVDPRTGTSAVIAGVSVPSVDGIVIVGNWLWAVQNQRNQVTRILLSRGATSGTVQKVITSELFQTPSTAARIGSRLAVVNAKFDTGFPPTADQYEVIVVAA